MTNMDENGITTSQGGFLTRPENRTGVVFAVVAIAITIIFFGSAVGEFAVHALDDMVHFAVSAVILSTMGWLALDPHFRRFISFLYMSLMRLITSFWISRDPIGMLKNCIELVKERLEKMDESISEFTGQNVKVARVIEVNEREIKKSLSTLEVAERKGNEAQKNLEARQVKRLSEQNERLSKEFTRNKIILDEMGRRREQASGLILDMGREISARQTDSDIGKASKRFVKNAAAILRGGTEKQLWDESVDVLEREYTQAIGQMDHFLDITKSMVDRADLENEAASEQGMQIFKDWQRKNAGNDFGDRKQVEAPPESITDSAAQKTKEGAR